MRRLTILRHAKSDWGNPQLDDFDRPLNARGRHAAEAVGRELKRQRARFNHVLASPALRVRQTLELFAAGFGELPAIDFQPKLYAASGASLLEAVRGVPIELGSVLLVGHNPGLHELVLTLAASGSPLRARVDVKYPTAAATTLEFGDEAWRTIAKGEIVRLILPRELDGS